MATFDKWIGGITSEESVRDAALHSLRSRLEALEHYLPLAAERPDEDVEYVHELRVFTRRSIAALRLYKELLPKERTSFPGEDAFGPWAASQLRKAVKRFFKASPSDHQDLETLHRFRIRGKELLAAAFPAELRQELYPAITEIQDQLGQIHDCVVASDRFGKWASQAKSKKEKTRLKERLESERDRLEALLGEFSDSWTAESQTQLRDAFDRLLASPNRETS